MGTGSAPQPDAQNPYGAGARATYDVPRGGGGFEGVAAPHPTPGVQPSNALGVLKLILRGVTLVFALISLSLISSTERGDFKAINFSRTFRFLVAIEAIVMVYSLAQLVVGLMESSGLAFSSTYFGSLVNFAADQLLAYMVFAACAASAEVTSALRSGDLHFFTSGGCDGGTDLCSQMEGGVALGFLSFAALALLSLFSGFAFAEQARKA